MGGHVGVNALGGLTYTHVGHVGVKDPSMILDGDHAWSMSHVGAACLTDGCMQSHPLTCLCHLLLAPLMSPMGGPLQHVLLLCP